MQKSVIEIKSNVVTDNELPLLLFIKINIIPKERKREEEKNLCNVKM